MTDCTTRLTGTGMWISPGQRGWAVLLTNKVYYTRDRQPLTDIRNAFRDLSFDSLRQLGVGQASDA